jgi:hypothetical protein
VLNLALGIAKHLATEELHGAETYSPTLDSASVCGYTFGMQKPAARHETPSPLTDRPDSYEEWLAAEIEAGCAELDAGESLPAERVWQELGLE